MKILTLFITVIVILVGLGLVAERSKNHVVNQPPIYIPAENKKTHIFLTDESGKRYILIKDVNSENNNKLYRVTENGYY